MYLDGRSVQHGVGWDQETVEMGKLSWWGWTHEESDEVWGCGSHMLLNALVLEGTGNRPSAWWPFFFFWLLGPVGNAGGLLAAWGWAGGISQMGSTGRGSRSGLWALDLDPEWHLDSRSLIFWSRGGVTHRLVKNPQTTKLLELGVPGFGFAPKCSLLFFF